MGAVYKVKDRELHRIVSRPNNPGKMIGMILPYLGTTVPAGWLLCNGQAVPQNTDLYSLMKTTPNLTDYVLVGAGQNTTDTIAAHDVFSIKEAKGNTIQSHYHSNVRYNPRGDYNTSASGTVYVTVATVTNSSSATSGPVGARTANQTRTKSVTVRYIIKAL